MRLPIGVDQVHVMQSMLDEGIATRRGVMCAHLEPAFRHEPWRPGEPGQSLAVSEEITADGLILPLYVDMTDEDQARVAEALGRAFAEENRALCP